MSISPDARISQLDSFGGASSSADGVRGQVPTPVAGDQAKFLRGDGSWAVVTATSGGSGTVTSVDVSGGTTGLSFSGGPITASGVITASGTLAAGSGGTGKATYSVGDILYATGASSLAAVAIGASGQVLTASNGVPVWAAAAGGTSTTAALATSAYVIIGTDASLSAYRSLTASTGISITDGGAAAPVTIALASQIVAGGPIGSASVAPVISFNAQGQLTTVTSAAITPTAIGAVPITRNVFASGALTGGGALSGDITVSLASIIAANTVGSTTRIPVVTFDVYGRITTATDAAITASGGGGGGSTVYTAQGTVDFGFPSDQEGDIATVTISATWFLASTIITVAPYAIATADHDPEDYAIEGITAYAANFATGVSFDIIAAAPNNSWGRYVINAMGV